MRRVGLKQGILKNRNDLFRVGMKNVRNCGKLHPLKVSSRKLRGKENRATLVTNILHVDSGVGQTCVPGKYLYKQPHGLGSSTFKVEVPHGFDLHFPERCLPICRPGVPFPTIRFIIVLCKQVQFVPIFQKCPPFWKASQFVI